MSATPTLDIQLLGKDYKVACPPEEQDALRNAAALLNLRLNAAAGNGKLSGERLVALVALNLAHELLATQDADSANSQSTSSGAASALDSDAFARRIQAIETRIDAVLVQG